jgi:hypothetical protein
MFYAVAAMRFQFIPTTASRVFLNYCELILDKFAADFCRRCLKAEDSRAAAADKRILTWRTWALSQLNSKIGMIASITAMGCGTWYISV